MDRFESRMGSGHWEMVYQKPRMTDSLQKKLTGRPCGEAIRRTKPTELLWANTYLGLP